MAPKSKLILTMTTLSLRKKKICALALEEFNSSLTIKSTLSPYGYTGCLKKSKPSPAVSLGNVTCLLFSKVRLSNYLQFQFYENEFHDLQLPVFVIKLVKIRSK